MRVRPANLPVDHQNLVAAYAGSDADPTTVALCPLMRPMPIPSLSQLEAHTGTLDVIEQDDGELVALVMGNPDGSTMGAWGRNDPVLWTTAFLTHFVPYAVARDGAWVVRTGTPGWATREYFLANFDPVGPFDTTDTGHPGLRGALLAAHDDGMWTLTVNGNGMWRYEVLP